MPELTDWSQVSIRGTFVLPNDARATGSWTAYLPVEVRSATGAKRIILPGAIATGTLSSNTAVPSLLFSAPCVDDPDMLPADPEWQISVVVSIDGVGTRTYQVSTPTTAIATGVDLHDYIPVEGTLGTLTTASVALGMPGGMARLSALGLPLTAAGIPVSANMIDVTAFGVVGGNAAADTAAVNTLIQQYPGRTLYFPPGTYDVDGQAVTSGTGGKTAIWINQAGTTLWLDRAATIRAIDSGTYAQASVITTTAADCRIVGGTVMGDLATHTGSTGEWSHGLAIMDGADRFTAIDVRVVECWGDGIYVGGTLAVGGPKDVALINCRATNNRRNNCSVVAGVRPHIIGGNYDTQGKTLAGVTKSTSPASGIDVEPNPNQASVLDFVISGVTANNCQGAGIVVVTTQATTTRGVVANSTATGNGTWGFLGSTGSPAGTTDVMTSGLILTGNTSGEYSSAIVGPGLRGQVAVRQTLTPLSGWTAVQWYYRHHGDKVEIVANLTASATVISNTTTTLATLPVGARPASTQYGLLQNRSNGQIYTLQIGTNGNIDALNLTTTGANTLIAQMSFGVN